jgi:hypothetical protein
MDLRHPSLSGDKVVTLFLGFQQDRFTHEQEQEERCPCGDQRRITPKLPMASAALSITK